MSPGYFHSILAMQLAQENQRSDPVGDDLFVISTTMILSSSRQAGLSCNWQGAG